MNKKQFSKKGFRTTGTALLLALLVMISLTGCGGTTAAEETPVSETYTLTGTGEGYAGPVIVEVQVTDATIQGIEVTEASDTPGLSDGAFDAMIEQIMEKQTVDGIDVVAGATGSSQGILEAVEDALSQI